jgi:hypothetical protein
MQDSAISGRLLVLAALAAPVLLPGCMKTATYGTGQAPEMALFREVTGGLLSRDGKEQIAYQPRAPLVMPPSAGQLPPPVESASAANPEWPQDPDRMASAGSDFGDENPADDIGPDEYRRLRPLAGVFPERRREDEVVAGEARGYQSENYALVNSRDKRRAFQQALAEAEGYGRTERRFLTDPPSTYREPAPTAPTTFEGVEENKGFFLTRWLTGG